MIFSKSFDSLAACASPRHPARMIALVVYTPGMVPLRGAEARAYARSGGMTATTAPTECEAFRGGVVPTYRRTGSLRPSERVGPAYVPTNRGRNAFPVAPAPAPGPVTGSDVKASQTVYTQLLY